MTYLEEQLARTRMSDGHHLSRQQITQHGRDRYPSVEAQALKVAAELGELIGEIQTPIWESGSPAGDPMEKIRKEYADVGLALHALGDKLGLDLIECMRELVDNDTRDFRD